MDVNKLKREAQKLQGKAETFLKDHHDQLESGVTKAETFVKSKSKTSKRDAQIDKVAGRLRNLLPADEPKPGTKPKHPEPGHGHQPKNMHTDGQSHTDGQTHTDGPAAPSA